MARSLTKKQKGFVKDYLETGNGSLSVKRNYDVTDDLTARVIASENLTKPNIKAYLDSKADDAATMIYILSQTAEAETVRLGASKDILDRAGYGAINKSESMALNVNVDSRIEDKDDLNAIREEFDKKLKAKLINEIP